MIEGVMPTPTGASLRVRAAAWGHRPRAGESVCVAGVCLTAVADATEAGAIRFDVVAETLGKTALGRLREGAEVNLEHACRADTLLGGHIVQGHVDGVGRVVAVRDDAADWRVEIEPPADLMPYVVPKGSVCVDGVSLTIARTSATSFGVALIPATLALTTLSALRAGDEVNIETDIVAKTVVNYMRNFAGR